MPPASLHPKNERQRAAESDGKGVGSGGWQGEVGRERKREILPFPLFSELYVI